MAPLFLHQVEVVQGIAVDHDEIGAGGAQSWCGLGESGRRIL